MDPNSNQTEQRPTYESLASVIDYFLLQPDLSEDRMLEGCRLAREYGMAAVVIRPSDADAALRALSGSDVKVAAAVDFPYGWGNTAAKLYEGRDLLRRGAKEIDFSLNIGKMLSRQFQHVESELLQMGRSCLESGATFKVVVHCRHLTEDLKIIAVKLAKRAEAHFISVDSNLAFFEPLLRDRIEMKITWGIDSLEQALAAKAAGCTRIGTAAAAAILDEWKLQLAQPAEGAVIS